MVLGGKKKMSEKIQEKINNVIKKRKEFMRKLDLLNLWRSNQIGYKDIRIPKKILKKTKYGFCYLIDEILSLILEETKLSIKEVCRVLIKRESYYHQYIKFDYKEPENLSFEDWSLFKKVIDCVLKHQNKLIEKRKIEKKKKELFKLTGCQKIYDQKSECDEVCEVCGRILELGEKCKCIEIEVL